MYLVKCREGQRECLGGYFGGNQCVCGGMVMVMMMMVVFVVVVVVVVVVVGFDSPIAGGLLLRTPKQTTTVSLRAANGNNHAIMYRNRAEWVQTGRNSGLWPGLHPDPITVHNNCSQTHSTRCFLCCASVRHLGRTTRPPSAS